MTRWVADTSVAVPLVVASHEAHDLTTHVVADRKLELAAHSALETYSVLTRLPGDARLEPTDAALLLRERFGPVLVLDEPRLQTLVDELAGRGVAGGAVYDALIAVTTQQAGAVLLTRDRRAEATYARMNVDVELVA